MVFSADDRALISAETGERIRCEKFIAEFPSKQIGGKLHGMVWYSRV